MIAIVPMKEISERVPNKNIRMVNGHPLFYWTFTALTKCKQVDQILLTTDSEILAHMVLELFPDVMIHFRPEELIGNEITANAIIKDVLESCFPDKEDFIYTHVTNPLLKAETIDQAITTFWSHCHAHDSLMGVTRYQIRLYDEFGVAINHTPNVILPTQQLKPVFEDNSCIYIFSRDTFEKHGRVGSKPYFFEIRKLESIDIDHEDDLLLAERIMQGYGY